MSRASFKRINNNYYSDNNAMFVDWTAFNLWLACDQLVTRYRCCYAAVCYSSVAALQGVSLPWVSYAWCFAIHAYALFTAHDSSATQFEQRRLRCYVILRLARTMHSVPAYVHGGEYVLRFIGALLWRDYKSVINNQGACSFSHGYNSSAAVSATENM